MVVSEKETCSSPYIFAHNLPSPHTPGPISITNLTPEESFWNASDPTCNASCSFLTLANQARPPCRLTYHCARPLGAVWSRIRHGGHTQRQGRCNREGKSEMRRQSPGQGSGNRLPCPVPHARRALRELQPSTESSSPQHQCSRLPRIHLPAVAEKYLSGTAKTKAGFLERPARRRSFGTRPNSADLMPPAPRYCRPGSALSLPWGRGGKKSGIQEPGPCDMTGNVVFLVSASPGIHTYWPCKLRSETDEATFFSSPDHRWSPLPVSNYEIFLLPNIEVRRIN